MTAAPGKFFSFSVASLQNTGFLVLFPKSLRPTLPSPGSSGSLRTLNLRPPMSATPTIPSSSSVLSRAHGGATLERTVHALVVSPRLEVRKPLVYVLESLSADVVTCSTCTQADEVLSHQSFEVVFCDEHLPDGSFADLIHANHYEHKIPRVIVATSTGEWEFLL